MSKINLKQSERAEQQTLIEWARLNEHIYPCLRFLHSSLNGEKLTIGQARQAVKSGLKKGVPDLCLPRPVDRPNFSRSGLYIEMKTRRGKVSTAQQEWLSYLSAVGYHADVCRSWVEARDEIIRYLTGKE